MFSMVYPKPQQNFYLHPGHSAFGFLGESALLNNLQNTSERKEKVKTCQPQRKIYATLPPAPNTTHYLGIRRGGREQGGLWNSKGSAPETTGLFSNERCDLSWTSIPGEIKSHKIRVRLMLPSSVQLQTHGLGMQVAC